MKFHPDEVKMNLLNIFLETKASCFSSSSWSSWKAEGSVCFIFLCLFSLEYKREGEIRLVQMTKRKIAFDLF